MWIPRTHLVGALEDNLFTRINLTQCCFIVVNTGSSLLSSSPSSRSSPEAIGLRRREMVSTQFFLLNRSDEFSKTKNSFFFENMYMLTPKEQFLAARTVNFSTKQRKKGKGLAGNPGERLRKYKVIE
ncbi:hypothetical protein RHGRI_023030 [Rhododendron griersonianum]|uniref:Uncharacterized protein n=1 Tax=Rhododendron griersonianum TaxID=479676 RepID=A0AAV6J6H4_9ERIC|nr:hypothetical protein RHGRI_023030 [Rhododendron griersonianum]